MEIKFKRDTSFRKQFFVPDSFAHPAKMDAQLLIWLTENYTNVGEIILDPMAGSGTMMLACTLGRNVILVELERKFCLMMKGGDCNGFECALCNQRMEWEAIETEEEFLLLADKQFPKNKQLEIAFTRYGWEWTRNRILHRYPQGAHHIVGNWEQVKQRPQFEELGGVLGDCQIIQGDARDLKGLLADKIITSPPYAETLQGSGADAARDRIAKGKYKGLRPDVWISKGNIAGSTFGDGYSRDPNNIGQLPYGNIDKIITSPPYEEAMGDKHFSPNADRIRREKKLSGELYSNERQEVKDNIGNLKGDTYLEAMALVYSQCFTVLKDGGLLILVTKNFIRNKQVIRLDEDTRALCEQAGFSFVERHFRRLPAQSFWRTIYQQKYPDVEVIQNEDILVFSKLIADKGRGLGDAPN